MGRFLLNFPDEAAPTPKWRARADRIAAFVTTGAPIVFLAATLLVIFHLTASDWDVNQIRAMIPFAAKAG
jgi:hypothetical protein